MSEPRYEHHFDFDCQGDPLSIEVWDNELQTNVMQLFFDPICISSQDWSWEQNDWELCPEAQAIMDRLNRE